METQVTAYSAENAEPVENSKNDAVMTNRCRICGMSLGYTTTSNKAVCAVKTDAEHTAARTWRAA